MKTLTKGAGSALALAAVFFATTVQAQTHLPSPNLGAGSSAQANVSTTLDPNEPSIMVTPSAFGGYRAPRQGDNDVGIVPISRWRAMGGSDQEFSSIGADNQRACARHGDYIQRATMQAEVAHDLGAEWSTVREDLVDMASQLNRASRARTGANVISTAALCAISLGWYCGAAASNGISNEITGRAHTRQSQLNVRQSDLNARQSQLNLDQMVLFTDMTIGWSLMISDYCVTWQAAATIDGAR